MRSRLVTAWSMLARLALNETNVPSGRASLKVRSDPLVWIVGPVLAGAVAGDPLPAGRGTAAEPAPRAAIPSSARPGRSRFASRAVRARSLGQLRLALRPAVDEADRLYQRRSAGRPDLQLGRVAADALVLAGDDALLLGQTDQARAAGSSSSFGSST